LIYKRKIHILSFTHTTLYKVMKKNIIYIAFTAFLIVWACDHGLAPPENTGPTKPTGISGTIFYKNWPPQDSVKNLKVVVFKNYPPKDILSEVINGNAKTFPEDLTESMPYGVDTTDYLINLKPGTYAYTVVAHQYGDDIFNDWQAVGQYDLTPQDTLPTPITVITDSIIGGINIYVDFDSLPSQPF